MKFSRDKTVFAFSPENPPVASIRPGDVFEVETEDCFYHQITTPDAELDRIDWERVNPATGPFFIEGAEPGDTLVVDILSIELDSQGVTVTLPGLGVLGEEVKTRRIAIPKIRDGRIYWDDERWLPARPMIGVIGVAPASGSVPTGTPGGHGGNMDTVDIAAGTRLRLPVFVPGALLCLGDVHAAMGDGEVCGTGIECRAVVTLKVGLQKNTELARPWLERDGKVMFVASDKDLFKATQIAALDVVKYLMAELALAFDEAYQLASAVADIRISQLVDPLFTVRAVVDQARLAGFWRR